MTIVRTVGSACLFVCVLVGCSSGSDSTSAPVPTVAAEAQAAVDTTTPTPEPVETVEAPDQPEQTEPAFTHKMMKPTGENPFAALGYECDECTFEQWLAIDPPEGWTKGPAQVVLPDRNELRSTPSFDGIADSMDFVAEVPGNEYELIVKNLNAELIERGANGVIARAQVMRDTLLGYSAGRRVHELTDPDGNVFVLIAYEVDPVDVVIPDFQDPDVLGDFAAPEGWTYLTPAGSSTRNCGWTRQTRPPCWRSGTRPPRPGSFARTAQRPQPRPGTEPHRVLSLHSAA